MIHTLCTTLALLGGDNAVEEAGVPITLIVAVLGGLLAVAIAWPKLMPAGGPRAPREIWIIYTTKVFEIVAYGLMSSTIVLWLSSDLGYSDAAAGDMIAIWSTILTLVTVMVGSLVDSIGIRKSFLLGFWLCLIPRAVMTATSDPWIAIPLGLFPMAVGLAMMVPVMNAALKRYSTPAQQTMAFALFYTLMNVGFAISGYLFDEVRAVLGEQGSKEILGMQLSTYRVLFFWGTVATVPGLVITQLFLRAGVEVSDDGQTVIHERTGKYKDLNVFSGTALSIRDAAGETVGTFRKVWGHSNFYRFMLFLTLIVMIRIVFYHMHYTFPKYAIRELGPGAKLGNLWSVLNPMIIVILTPLVAAFSGRASSYGMIAIGSSFAAIPVFLMAVPPEMFQGLADGWLGNLIGHTWLGLTGPVDPLYVAIALFVVFFSIGEAIWSPRLYQYTAAIAPKGQEGSYMAMSLLPYFFAKLVVGMMSGRMLEKWCPADGVLAKKKLIAEYGMSESDFVLESGKAMHPEDILPILAEKLGYVVEAGGKMAQDVHYQLWQLLHDAYPRDSTTLWLVVACMALTCPIGIILLRKVIHSREDGGPSNDDGPLEAALDAAAHEEDAEATA